MGGCSSVDSLSVKNLLQNLCRLFEGELADPQLVRGKLYHSRT